MRFAAFIMAFFLAGVTAACGDTEGFPPPGGGVDTDSGREPTPAPTAFPTPTPAPSNCRAVTYVPIVLYYPGCYRFAGDLVVESPTGPAVRAATGGVDIDLAGFELSCEGCDGSLHQVGILTRRKNGVTVRNGRIRGFPIGVRMDDDGYERLAADSPLAATGVRVQSLEVVDSSFRGIRVEARDAIIESCTVVRTGAGALDGDLIMGIEVYGPRAKVRENHVLETQAAAGGEGVGISISDFGNGSAVLDNVISISTPGPGADYGVWIGGDSDVSVRRNVVDGYRVGIAFSSTTSGEYYDNEVTGAETPYAIWSESVQGDVAP